MQFTKKQYVFGAILGLAAGALAVDQFGGFSRTTDNAAADVQVATAAHPRVANKAATTAPTIAASVRNPLAARLETVALAQNLDADQPGDAFATAGSWVAAVDAPGLAVKTDAEAEAELNRRNQFAQQHKLTAVMKTSRGGVAVIDGKMLRQGQTLAGFELSKVSETAATFRRANNNVELKLQTAGTGPLASADR